MSTLPQWPPLLRGKYTTPGALLFLSLILFLLLTLVFSFYGGAALAKAAKSPTGAAQFTRQERIGFQSGDDWEPSITADRYGHIYTLFKHYDVTGGQTCTRCDLHLLVQRSDDGGRT